MFVFLVVIIWIDSDALFFKANTFLIEMAEIARLIVVKPGVSHLRAPL